MTSTDHGAAPEFPKAPVHAVTPALRRFILTETASGLALLLAALIALGLANLPSGPSLDSLWRTTVGVRFGDAVWEHSLRHWINDGLMTIFFFVVGLEIKREMVTGELRRLKVATLPIAAALGGMVAPAALYLALATLVLPARPLSASGWGVVMATDIAFAVGCLALLGRRVPVQLRVFVLALAIIDDIGAVVVIAAGYSQALHLIPFVAAVGGLLVMALMQWAGIRAIGAYWFVGALTWAALHESGVHPALAGVVIGLITPARPWIELSRLDHFLEWALGVAPEPTDPEFAHKPKPVRKRLARAATESLSPSQRLEDFLHPWSAFLVLPLFALANAGVSVSIDALSEPISIAIIAGLAAGKPLGIFASSWLAVKSGVARKPDEVTWPMVAAAGMLAGIGFTMSLFIANLAFDEAALRAAKVGILGASLISGALGLALLWMATTKRA
jgi:NhaA family Na+:H+ antiporter